MNIIKYLKDNGLHKRMILLFAFWKFVDYFPYIKKYKLSTKYSVYRSLICLALTFYALESIINNFIFGFKNPFNHNNTSLFDVSAWFFAFILHDLIQMIIQKEKRIDLYIHHIFFAIVSLTYIYTKKVGFMSAFLIISEAISIVTGIDKMAMEDNKLKESKKYKLYRKIVIKYLRMPIWILLLLFTIRHKKKQPYQLFILNIVISLFMLKLDKYWENKCDKILKKN